MNTSPEQLSVQTINTLATTYSIDPVFLEKDWYTQQILGVIAGIQSDEFQPIFCGGTSLSKGYRLINRFSEDIDFKFQPLKPGLSRRIRSAYQDRVIEIIQTSSPELELIGIPRKRNSSSFVNFEIGYPSYFPHSEALRPQIRVEFTFEAPALEPELRSLSSLIAQLTDRAQGTEIANFPCASLAETAAEKVASLIWRTFRHEPDNEKYDPRIIRHLHDLAYLAPYAIDHPDWRRLTLAVLSNDISTRDKTLAASGKTSEEFLETFVPRLTANPLYEQHYLDFVQALSYDNNPQTFAAAIDSLKLIVDLLTVADSDRAI
jgi:predicted nucleotidyltransferase component of viral defense system